MIKFVYGVKELTHLQEGNLCCYPSNTAEVKTMLSDDLKN